MLLERTVIRHLYGRPLETLLATGHQHGADPAGAGAVRGAERRGRQPGVAVGRRAAVAEPGAAVEPHRGDRVRALGAGDDRLLLNKTRLGMNVRAVTQNRAMAACCGVPTGRVDMLAFGLGSGIAGLGGVALSQLGNVGPELGQGYIIDSFGGGARRRRSAGGDGGGGFRPRHRQQDPRAADRRRVGQDPDHGADRSVYSKAPAGAVRPQGQGD